MLCRSRAVLKAVQLRERHGGEVVVVTMGPPAARAALVDCLALGADRVAIGGIAVERQQETQCNAVDNPNNLRFCDDQANGIPFSIQFKAAGSYPLKWGILLSGSFQSNQSPSGTFGSATTTQYMSITRGSTRYPANCPGACAPYAGQVILPSSFIGSPLTPTTLSVALTPPNAYFLERINQLDFKVQKNFKVNRFTVSPQFEIFNVNNSAAMISTITNNVLSTSYRYSNSIMQPRMIGSAVQVKW